MSVPSFDYIAYFDEAGDPGIRRVVPVDPSGGTEWFVLGCVVIKASREKEPIDFIKRARMIIKSRQRPDIHYKNLKAWQRVKVCQEAAKENARFFCLASNKISMRGYKNPAAAATSLHPNNFFYNYCIRILLERVTEWVERRSLIDFGEPRKVKLVFSERGGHSYRHVKTYTEVLRIQEEKGRLFQSARAPKFEVLDANLIEVIRHDQNAGLQMADIVASAFYHAANARASNWDIEPAKALKPRMAYDRTIVANTGLTLLPWRTWKSPLTNDQKKIFSFYGHKL
ncbi:DUF3800 domain-containing protein [Agrobacterium cavarae]|uniref:DUF3800 domain-containing protein n=1 Tax=Agrobacterium cavarae TaxID=2528239 RepID=UPI000DE05EDB|nr:DUF3800 domain-containing protein [Agrobacterium cavarae]